MDSILGQIREVLRILRYQRREQKTALLAAGCFAAIPLLKLLPLDPPYQSIVTWTAVGLGTLFVVLTAWRLRRYTLAPPEQKQVPGAAAIKGAGSFTPEDAQLFAKLGRLEELKQLRSWVLDDKLPVVVVMGESGAGKTSLLRAGLTFILGQGKEGEIPCAYWEANPVNSRESFLHAVEAQLGQRDLKNLPPSVIVVDQLEQLHPDRDPGFFQLLRQHIESVPPFTVTWILAFRREFGATWMDFQLDLPERFRHRLQMLSLRRFSLQQAKEVFATLAEEADLPVRESLMEEVLSQLVEDGSISPVDLGITLQVLHRQPELAADATAFRFAGGQAGLLTLYLEMNLEPYPPTLRDEVLRALLSLMDQESYRRLSGGLQIDELRAQVEPQAPRHFELALETLAQPGVRVLEIVEERPRRYRLIHERFIPAVRRLAGELLGAADHASRLLERRFRLWEHEERKAGFLLRGAELREVLEQRASLRWGTSREEKWRFLKTSRWRQLWRRILVATSTALVALSIALAIHQQRVRAVQKELFEWGLPEGTYNLLPRITHLTIPQVSNLRWLSRAENLVELEVALAPQYTTERGQNWPRSLKRLSVAVKGSSLPEFPATLQQLNLSLWGSQVSGLPEFPATLQQLNLDLSYSRVTILPDFPPTLQRLNLDLTGSAVSILPAFPSTLQQLNLDLSRSVVSILPAFPSTLQQLNLDLTLSVVSILPAFPSTLQQLNLDFSRSEVSILPAFPSTLQQLQLVLSDSRGSGLPAFPSTLQQLNLDLSDSRVSSLPAFPSTLQQLNLDLGGSEVWGLPAFPSTLQQLNLDLSHSEVSGLPAFPSTLQQLDLNLSESRVSSLPAFPSTLQQLSLGLSGSELSSLPVFPSTLQQLSLGLSGSELSSLPAFPSTLQQLSLGLSGSELSSLPAFPSTLQQLSLGLSGSELLSLPAFPSTLQQLDIDLLYSVLSSLPAFPSTLQQLSLGLSGSELLSLPAFPSTLQRLNLDLTSSRVSSLAELPRTVRCFALEVSQGSSLVLPEELPYSVESVKLGVGRDFGRSEKYSCDIALKRD